MDTNDVGTTTTMYPPVFSGSNLIIVILVLLLVLTFFGINLLSIFANLLQGVATYILPSLANVLAMFGYSTGELINTTADVAADASKLGIDIAEGTAQSVGNLLKTASAGKMDEKQKRSLDQALKSPYCPDASHIPEPDKSTSSIQQSGKSAPGGWCFAGEYDGVRGCVAMSEHGKCMSGQIFPTQKMCLNPNLYN